jgi:general secretion pathway protein A
LWLENVGTRLLFSNTELENRQMFGQTVDKMWYFESPVHEEAQNRLMYVAEQGEPFVLLVGERGLGKSSVLHRVQAECRRYGHSSVMINVAALDEDAFLWHLCGGLSINPSEGQSRSQMMNSIRDEVSGRAVCNHRTIILLDDLNRAGADLSLMVQFLSAINQQTAGGVSVIAATEGSLSPDLQQLSALRVQLSRLDQPDSRAFVEGMLESADVDTVTADGLAAIVESGEGSPAQLSRICELIKVAAKTNPGLKINSDVLSVLTEETLAV